MGEISFMMASRHAVNERLVQQQLGRGVLTCPPPVTVGPLASPASWMGSQFAIRRQAYRVELARKLSPISQHC